ncbi:MAG TPA: hypothetical protein VIS56_02465 [Candidatus Saccharimonadales bacterium]
MGKVMTDVVRWGALAIGSVMVVFGLGIQTASAVNFFDDVCDGVGSSSAACSGTGKDTISGADGIILQVANLIAIIAGIAAVFMIIIAGFMFITAAGDSSKVTTARNTIIYTVVGLIVIVLARAIIGFVVTRV